METSDNVARMTLLQHLIMTSSNQTLQRRCFCNVIWCFHGNYMATSERRQIALRNNVVTTLLCLLGLSSIVIASEKWNSLLLNGIKVPCYLVFSFLIFRLEPSVRKNTRMKAIFVTVMVIISKSTILKITWSQLCLKFFLNNNKAHCQTPYNWRFYGNWSTCVLILSWVDIMKQKSTELFGKLSVV